MVKTFFGFFSLGRFWASCWGSVWALRSFCGAYDSALVLGDCRVEKTAVRAVSSRHVNTWGAPKDGTVVESGLRGKGNARELVANRPWPSGGRGRDLRCADPGFARHWGPANALRARHSRELVENGDKTFRFVVARSLRPIPRLRTSTSWEGTDARPPTPYRVAENPAVLGPLGHCRRGGPFPESLVLGRFRIGRPITGFAERSRYPSGVGEWGGETGRMREGRLLAFWGTNSRQSQTIAVEGLVIDHFRRNRRMPDDLGEDGDSEDPVSTR